MSLKEQMLKAGLITEQEAKQVTHKTRVEHKKTDRKHREAEAEKSAAQLESQKQAEIQKDRERNRTREEERKQAESGHQERQRSGSALSLVYKDGLIGKWAGQRRYYFAQEGRVEFLLVSDDVGRKLENGQAAIVQGEKNPARLCLMTGGAARKLSELEAGRIVTFHENSTPPPPAPEPNNDPG